MKKYILPMSLLASTLYDAQTNTENYIQSRTYLEPVTSTSTTAKQSQRVSYYDGLGRPKQIVNVKASPLGNDVVTKIEYDPFGRQTKDYLPVPQTGNSNGAIYGNPLANVTSTPYGTEKIYSEKVLEASPLDRIQQQVQVGNAWNNKPVAFGYETNTATEVKKFVTTTTWPNNATSSVLTQSGNYGAAQLYKNTVTDEDGNATIDFRNGQGQTLLVRKNDGTRDSDTYYVYNEYDQLAFVISPEAAAKTTISQTDLDELCYQYRYDGRNRVVEKKLPGKGWEYMIYDKADRLAMSQDANLRLTGEWLFTKYDQFGRVLYTGIAPGGGSRSDMQGWISDYSYTHEERSDTPFVHSGLSVYYTNNAIPGSVSNILSVNYYDTYPKGTPSLPGLILYQDAMPQTGILSTKGMPMASFVKNIEDDKWTKSYTVYDKKGRPIGHYSYNHLGGYTKTESFLDFTGVAQKTETRHKRLSSNTEVLIEENFTYDDQNRLLTHTHKVNGNAPVTLAQNEYNEIGQLVEKQVGGDQNGNNPLQTVNYAYNIRGWMRGINLDANNNPQTGKLFNYRIKYNDPENASIAPARYNGNIAEIDWWGDTGIRKRYGYQYDRLNRLLKGVYQDPDRTSPMTGINDESILYDLNGNITNLYRNTKHNSLYTAVMIDNLGYTYTGNRVTSISDATNNRSGYEGGGGTIGYDPNGNMTSMPDKGISNISYNYLNLPTEIYQNDNVLEYHYRADGVKVKKMFTLNNDEGTSIINTEYLDGFQYSTPNTEPIRRAIEVRDDTTVSAATAGEEEAFLPSDRLVADPGGPVIDDMILSFFPTAEGYYDYENFRYIYQYRDHLGNVRVSYVKDGNNLKIMDTNDYYPFGMSFLKPTVRTVYDPMAIPYNYKYNGKELQETGMYDYGARSYMPDIGRWGVIDPLAEKYFNISSFNYAANNPILYIDPDGMQLDLSDIMKKGNEEQYKAFVFFAKTKEGQAFLSKYMEKGQTITYGGKTIFEAKSNGEFHDKGIDLSYGVRTDNDAGSYTGGSVNIKDDKVNVNIMISKNAFGDSGSQFFNTLEHITHESFLHADLTGKDLRDDGYKNSSSIPKEYRQYDSGLSRHGQHYYIQAEYLKDPTNSKVNAFTKEGFKILQQANEALKLKLGDSQIKKQMWTFSGSYLNVTKDGKLVHQDSQKK